MLDGIDVNLGLSCNQAQPSKNHPRPISIAPRKKLSVTKVERRSPIKTRRSRTHVRAMLFAPKTIAVQRPTARTFQHGARAIRTTESNRIDSGARNLKRLRSRGEP